MQTDDAEIGYILKGYPRTSETFITNEIFLLEQTGLKLSLFSIKRLEGQKRHGVVGQITAPVTYLPQIVSSAGSHWLGRLWRNVPNFTASHGRLFRRRPLAYLRTLFEALWMRAKYRRRAFIKEFLQAGFIASEVAASGRIRHLHAHFCHTSTTVAMLASRMAGVPFSFTAHAKDIYQTELNPGRLLERKLGAARFVATCTCENARVLRARHPRPDEVHAIYHGLDTDWFSPGFRLAREGAPLLLAVGRLVEKKGFRHLVEAAARVPGIHVVIGGAGDLRDDLARRARESGAPVTLAGVLDRARVDDALAAADVASTDWTSAWHEGRRRLLVIIAVVAMTLVLAATAVGWMRRRSRNGASSVATSRRVAPGSSSQEP